MRLGAAVLLYLASAAAWNAAAAGALISAPTGNKFLLLNPGYREQAGSHYEQSYLPGATQGLVAALTPETITEKDAEAVLRTFIYDFLNQMILDEGEVDRRAHASVLQRLDAAIGQRTRDENLLERYAAWKIGSHDDYHNPLAFLTHLGFQSPPVLLALSDDLARETSVRSLTSLAETAAYTSMLGVEPYQVFVISQEAAARAAPHTMTLLLYRKAQAASVLAAIKASAASDRPQIFWQTRRHLVVALAGETQADWRERLSRRIREQWTE